MDWEREKRDVEARLAAQGAWGEWLATYDWDWFGTVSFRLPRRDPILSIRAFEKVLKPFPVARAFVGAERHRSGDVHLHCLLAFPDIALPGPTGRDLWSAFFRRLGRSSFEVPRNIKSATEYCTKYCVKGLTDYKLLGDDWFREDK